MKANVHRNDPCPCGSGKKYKQCHGRGGASLTRPVSLPLWGVVGILVVVGGAGAMLYQATQAPPTGGPGTLPAPSSVSTSLPVVGGVPGGPMTPGTGGSNPAPYQYDARTNKYWDPTHNHWHDGQPPANAAGGTITPTITPLGATPANAKNPTPTPAPFTYNPTTNQYWSPKHGHWHNGRPPIDSLRSYGLPLDDAAPAAPAPTVTISPIPATPPAAAPDSGR